MIDIASKLFSKNTLAAKIKRTVTSILPVAQNRQGKCKRCGACCKLPNTCLFLIIDEQGACGCKIYKIRPLNCRKYPRTKSELLTADTCGYNFAEK